MILFSEIHKNGNLHSRNALRTLQEPVQHGMELLPPPTLVQATISDQKLTEPTPGVAERRKLLMRCTVNGTSANNPQEV